MKIISGNSNVDLAKAIVGFLGTKLIDALVSKFSDGEIRVEINENVRGKNVFVIQSTCQPVNDNMMELLIMIDALKRASARRIIAVMPYYGYARQDRKVVPRAPISAKLVADLLAAAGASRILTMDLHAGQIQGFFNIPADNLYASTVLLEYLKEKFSNSLVIVSPDAGGAERARAWAKRLEASWAIVDKRRDAVNESEVMNVIGDVENKTAIILDDMIDTGGTTCNAALAIKKRGASEVYAVCTHPVLSGSAVQKISESVIKQLVVTDTIPLSGEAKILNKTKIVSVAGLFAEAIKRVHNNESVSSLFV